MPTKRDHAFLTLGARFGVDSSVVLVARSSLGGTAWCYALRGDVVESERSWCVQAAVDGCDFTRSWCNKQETWLVGDAAAKCNSRAVRCRCDVHNFRQCDCHRVKGIGRCNRFTA